MCSPAPTPCRAFTLIELLVVIAILGVLIAIVLPVAATTIASARGFRCQMSQRAVAFDFDVFADPDLHGSRGDDDSLRGGRFRLETFQDSQYCLNEFWCWPGENTHETPDFDGHDPMRCSEVDGSLTLRANAPCTNGGLTPAENVSFGFNGRLHVRERRAGEGGPPASFITLTHDMLNQPDVPLLWDVDAGRAANAGVNPVFSAPALDSPLVFAQDRQWFPGTRHNGRMNIAFIDGHVDASRTPLDEAAWRWDYVPVR